MSFKKKLNEWCIIGGEVINDSDTTWTVHGGASPLFFFPLKPGERTDSGIVKERLRQTTGECDVDGVWPLGTPIKNGNTGQIVSSGVFKLKDHRNTNITGNKVDGYVISDFSEYIKEEDLGDHGWDINEHLVPNQEHII